MHLSQTTKKLLASITSKSPLTKQCLFILVVCGYLLLFVAGPESDIVATALTLGLCLVIFIITTYTILYATIAKNRIELSVSLPSESLYAAQSFTAILSLSSTNSMPGILHEFSPIFEHQGATATKIRLLTSPESARIALSITLPHRGNWRIPAIKCSIKDVTGFVDVTWTIPIDTTCCVLPQKALASTYPVLSSTQRAGDIAPDLARRVGDPYDLKQYHPSDGVKKIVWKVFAKSGELLSRHPEPSMTPEGFVGVFVAARRTDDTICSAALDYITALEELEIDIRLACEGLNDLPIAHDPASSKDLLIDAVWNSNDSSSPVPDIQKLLDACSQYITFGAVETILIFVSGDRLEQPDEATKLVELGEWLEQQGISPTFMLIEPSTNSQGTSIERTLLEKLYLVTTEDTPTIASGEFRQFLATCLTRHWEVHT